MSAFNVLLQQEDGQVPQQSIGTPVSSVSNVDVDTTTANTRRHLSDMTDVCAAQKQYPTKRNRFLQRYQRMIMKETLFNCTRCGHQCLPFNWASHECAPRGEGVCIWCGESIWKNSLLPGWFRALHQIPCLTSFMRQRLREELNKEGGQCQQQSSQKGGISLRTTQQQSSQKGGISLRTAQQQSSQKGGVSLRTITNITSPSDTRIAAAATPKNNSSILRSILETQSQEPFEYCSVRAANKCIGAVRDSVIQYVTHHERNDRNRLEGAAKSTERLHLEHLLKEQIEGLQKLATLLTGSYVDIRGENQQEYNQTLQKELSANNNY